MQSSKFLSAGAEATCGICTKFSRSACGINQGRQSRQTVAGMVLEILKTRIYFQCLGLSLFTYCAQYATRNVTIQCFVQSIFRTPVASYDVLVEFHPECLPNPSQVLFPPKGLGNGLLNVEAPKLDSTWLLSATVRMGIRVARDHLLIGLNPVQEFVEELKVLVTCFWFGLV